MLFGCCFLFIWAVGFCVLIKHLLLPYACHAMQAGCIALEANGYAATVRQPLGRGFLMGRGCYFKIIFYSKYLFRYIFNYFYKMVKDFDALDLTKQYTYADYLTWRFKERVELFKGWVMKMSPAPSSLHQRISMHISYRFMGYLNKSSCSVYSAPFDVRLDALKSSKNNAVTTVVQPDICIICDEKKVDIKGCKGAPDLIVEIVSKGNTKKELENKFELYQENGVREYWIVFQNDETINVFDLVNGAFKFRKTYSNDSIIPVGIFENFEINLADVF